MVKSNSLFSVQEYLELVTGNCYIVDGDNDIAFIEDIVNRLTPYTLWNYPLDEIDHIVENHLNVVLVDCCVFIGGVLTHEYRWFEVPEEVPEYDSELEPDFDDGSDIGCKDCPDDECTGHCMSCCYRPI